MARSRINQQELKKEWMMGCGSMVGGLLLCLVFLIGACSESNNDTGGNGPTGEPSSSDSADGETVGGKNAGGMDGAAAWEAGNCTMCHGADGAGSKFGPDLTTGVWNNCDGTAAGIRGVLAAGVTKDQMGDRSWALPMPAAPEAVSSDEALDVLTDHVLSLSK